MYRNCLVCGKSFKVCNTCQKDIPEELQWRRVVCCPEHFQYHVPIIQYVRKNMDKKTAKSELGKAIAQYGEIEYCDEIKPVVAEILGTNKIVKSAGIDTSKQKIKK